MIKLINEATEPKYWNSRFAANVVNAYDSGELTLRNIDEWETNYNGGVRPQPSLGTKEILNYYISTGKDPREDESNNLSDFRGNSRAGNATRVRIKATGKTGWVESVVDDKWGQGIRVVYDDRPGMWPDFFTVDEVEILEPVKKPKTESFDDDFEQYTYVKSKDVYDANGYLTEYTMYYDKVEDRYVFVLGDSDIYNPNDGYEEFDYECDTEREANEWF